MKAEVFISCRTHWVSGVSQAVSLDVVLYNQNKREHDLLDSDLQLGQLRPPVAAPQRPRCHRVSLDSSGSVRRQQRPAHAKGCAARLIGRAARDGDDIGLLAFGGAGLHWLLRPGPVRRAAAPAGTAAARYRLPRRLQPPLQRGAAVAGQVHLRVRRSAGRWRERRAAAVCRRAAPAPERRPTPLVGKARTAAPRRGGTPGGGAGVPGRKLMPTTKGRPAVARMSTP